MRKMKLRDSKKKLKEQLEVVEQLEEQDKPIEELTEGKVMRKERKLSMN